MGLGVMFILFGLALIGILRQLAANTTDAVDDAPPLATT
jgi:hypothetical protein